MFPSGDGKVQEWLKVVCAERGNSVLPVCCTATGLRN